MLSLGANKALNLEKNIEVREEGYTEGS